MMGHPCMFYEETDSTNLRARQLADEGAVHGTLVWAERQTAGRGRRGRAWDSSSGEAIYMSLLLRPEIEASHASMLTLVMGLAAANACNELLELELGKTAPKVQLKWPNDLVLNGKKIAGILTEMRADIAQIQDVIIGMGINVNTKAFPEELTAASSLARETGKVYDREKLLALCMKQFEDCYEKFVQREDLSELRDAYECLLVNCGRTVRVLEPGHEYQGFARGINAQGELLVERETGEITAVYAGEVSVRGVYGYV